MNPVSPAVAPQPLTFLQAALLAMGAWCTVLAAGAVAPVLPQMHTLFADVANVDLLIGFVATAPSLAVALLAMPIGILADRIGLRPVFLGGLLIYGISGVIPLFALSELSQIVGLRFVTGIGEAAVMTSSTALIGVMAAGAARDRLFAAQAVSANILGVFVLLVGGAAGLLGWRAPFFVYSFALVMFAPVFFTIRPAAGTGRAAQTGPGPTVRESGLLGLTVETCLLIAWSTMALYAVILQTGFLLVERGAGNSAAIGMGQAIAACGIAAGALAGGMLSGVSVRLRLTAAYALMAAGFLLVSLPSAQLGTSMAGAVAGLGCGVVLPTLLSRLLGRTPAALAGRITGIWVAATFLAQFASPPVFLFLKGLAGSLAGAFALFACGSLGVALIVAARNDRSPRPGVYCPRPDSRS